MTYSKGSLVKCLHPVKFNIFKNKQSTKIIVNPSSLKNALHHDKFNFIILGNYIVIDYTTEF